LKLHVVGNGSSSGVRAVSEGKADIGMISSSVESMKKKIQDAKWDKIKSHDIGIACIAFVVHKKNPVTNLTLAQLTDILSGKIKKWSEVGGEDKPIVIVSEFAGGGTHSTVGKNLLRAAIGGKLKELANAPQIIKVTSQLPTALGVANSAILSDKIKEIKTDKNIEQPLTILTIGDPSVNAKKLIDAIKALNIK